MPKDLVDVIGKINSNAASISENDIDEWVVPSLLELYNYKIGCLAVKAYGKTAQYNQDGKPSIAQMAFKERARAEIRSAVYTFLFKSEHWKSGRDINSYLLTCLNRLSDRIKWDADTVKKINVPVCPAAKYLSRKEYLVEDGQFLRSQFCKEELDHINEEIERLKLDKNTLNDKLLIKLESRRRLFSSFFLHSRKGYRCPDCCRFIPESVNGPHGISCPYDDCFYIGNVNELEKMAHPVGLSSRIDVSLQSNDSFGHQIQDMFTAEVVNADKQIEINENFGTEYKLLVKVIDEQVESCLRNNSSGTMTQKLRMYEAYKNILQKYPEDMVSYLVHKKQNADFPIQARIFQEYVKLMQDSLPFNIQKGDEIYEVLSLTDPNISLFLGVSEFDATVRGDGTIPNNTTESYVGGRKFKDYGPCFLGLLIDVIDRNTKQSIKDKVKDYSFVQINTEGLKVGTPVTVIHYRIPSHYEMKSMVYLQRLRKRIVTSIDKRTIKNK